MSRLWKDVTEFRDGDKLPERWLPLRANIAGDKATGTISIFGNSWPTHLSTKLMFRINVGPIRVMLACDAQALLQRVREILHPGALPRCPACGYALDEPTNPHA